MKPEVITWFRRAFLRHDPRRYAVMQPETADRKYDDYPGELTDTQIAAHLDGRAAYAVPTAENGLAHLLPLDIDAGGEDAARALLDAATERGLWAFAQVDTARARGYVWIPFDDLVNAERIRRLGDELLDQVQPQAKAWRIENRATNEDTRLPFAKHRWTGKRGQLITQDGTRADLDTGDLAAILATFTAHYRENPASTLPPPPEPQARQERPAGPQGQGVTITSYNASADLAQLLEHYGARPARGRGARLYLCPFHPDDHASLLISKDGARCHCLSRGSDCPLSAHQNDAFNVFCIGEALTSEQALRRLNGLPDDPTPEPGRGSSPPKTGPRTPPAGPGNAEAKKTTQGPGERFASVRASKKAQRPPAPANQEPRTTASDGRRLPKSARRVLDYISAQPGDYYRGKYHIADQLDIDPRTVQRSLRRLEIEGLITRHERGREGQTDIYRLACVSYDTPEEGAANRVDNDLHTAPDADEGRQLPPTLEHESIPTLETLEAERGGSCPPTGDGQAEGLALSEPDPEGTQRGPAGAILYPGGAAYVPPQAVTWYSTLPPELRGEHERQEEPPTPEQAELSPPAHELATAEPLTAQPKKRQRRRPRYVDPGHLYGRIIAAEKKAEKLERSGRDADRRQARAIRRQAETLKRQLEALREAPPQAIGEDEETAEDWTPAPTLPTAPPSSSSFGVDWAYLERLYCAGEVRGIERHCALWRADVDTVCAELARRGITPQTARQSHSPGALPAFG